MGLASVTFSETWNEDHILIVYLLEKDKKVKVKVTLEQATKAQRESRGIVVLFLNLGARLGVGGQRQAPASLPLGKTWYSLYRRLGGPQGSSGQVQKMSPPPGFDPRTNQPVASCYNDYAIPAHFGKRYDFEIPKCPSSCH
jgi:hypothetical protein